MSQGYQPPPPRAVPRIGLTALIKYMDGSAAQRLEIVRNQKYPVEVKQHWYKAATGAISRYIAGGMIDPSILSREIADLRGRTPSNNLERNRINTNIEAIERFSASLSTFDLNGLDASFGDNKTPKLVISGVEISVRPEIILKGVVRNVPQIGSLKIYMSKSDRLSREAVLYGTLLVRNHGVAFLAGGATIRNQNCMLIDVFSGEVLSAPQAAAQRMRNLEAACSEIGLWWNSI